MDKDEQNHYSKKAKGIYGVGHDSIRLMKWRAFIDSFWNLEFLI